MKRAPHSVTASAIGLLSLGTRYHIPRGDLLFLLRKFAVRKRIGCNHELMIKIGAEYASVTRHRFSYSSQDQHQYFSYRYPRTNRQKAFIEIELDGNQQHVS